MEDENSNSGVFVSFDHYIRMSDGRIERTRDQIGFPGTIEQFRKVHPNVAVIGYHEMEGTTVTERCFMLNEKLPPLPKLQEGISGAITPEVIQEAAEKTKMQEKQQETTQEAVLETKSISTVADKLFKDGDSFIRVSGGKVFKLKWITYDDDKAEFDHKIKFEDGKIRITHWEELES